MPNNNCLKLAGEWFQKANEDEETVEILLKEDGPMTIICFHCHQMAEKYLKGFLIAKAKKITKIHDLLELLRICEGINKGFSELKESCNDLNVYYIPPRYPGGYTELYSKNETEEAFEKAKAIKDFVIEEIIKAKNEVGEWKKITKSRSKL